jgi:hypothetical protein
LLALTLASVVPFLETCSGCGTVVEGSLCIDGGECATSFAFTVAGSVVVAALCGLFASNATTAFRMRRARYHGSLLTSAGRTDGALAQVLSLSSLAGGALLAGVGALAPWFSGFACHEGCPPPYILAGPPLDALLVGAGLAIVGAAVFLRTSRPRAA